MSRSYTFRDARLRSPALRAINSAGACLRVAGLRLPRLNPTAIIETANQAAYTDLTPDHALAEALERYIDSAETDANLNTFGRMAVKNMLVGALTSRFALEHWHQRHPELEQETIDQPWIVIGLPRTGTSILSILLGLDPFNRALLQWEAQHPVPPSTLANAEEDPRVALHAKTVAQMHQVNPAISSMHPFGSTLAEECTAVFTYSLRTIGMETIAFTPSYGHWLDAADATTAYQIHQKMLQALQQARPTSHWVMKSPNHLWNLPAMLSAYPDARVIWTHRDPAKLVPSLASLNSAMQMPFTRKLNPPRVGEYWASKVDTAIARAMDFDANADTPWCCHVQYQDLVSDPQKTLNRIYNHFDTSTNALHLQRVNAWLGQSPQHSAGKHKYDAADFGWTKNSLNQRYRDYLERYQIPGED